MNNLIPSASFLLILIFISGVKCQGSVEPEIVEHIRPEVKKIAQEATLRCTVSNKGPSYKVFWQKIRSGKSDLIISKDDKIITFNKRLDTGIAGDQAPFKYSIFGDTHPGSNHITYRLVIRDLVTDDGGQYKCILRTDSQTRSTFKIGHLTVQTPPKILSSGSTNTESPDLGEDFTLSCRATGNPTPKMKWMRQDGRLLPSGEREFYGPKYIIRNVSANDRGVYRCVASNNVKPPDEHDARLLVKYSPYIRAVQDSIGQAENRQLSVKLECEVSGYPEPVVEWFLEDPESKTLRQLSRDNKYDITQTSWFTSSGSDDMRLNVLTIKNVRSNDFAFYYCQAKNSIGTNRATIELYETAQCQGTACPNIDNFGSNSVVLQASLYTITLTSFLSILYHLHT